MSKLLQLQLLLLLLVVKSHAFGTINIIDRSGTNKNSHDSTLRQRQKMKSSGYGSSELLGARSSLLRTSLANSITITTKPDGSQRRKIKTGRQIGGRCRQTLPPQKKTMLSMPSVVTWLWEYMPYIRKEATMTFIIHNMFDRERSVLGKSRVTTFRTRSVRDQHGHPWYFNVDFDIPSPRSCPFRIVAPKWTQQRFDEWFYQESTSDAITLELNYDGELYYGFNQHLFKRYISIKKGSIQFKNCCAEFTNGYSMRCQSGNRGLVRSDWSKNQILRGCDDKGTFIVEVHIEFEYISAANTNCINFLKEQKQDIRYIDEDIAPSSCMNLQSEENESTPSESNGKKLKLLWSRIKALGKTKKDYMNTSLMVGYACMAMVGAAFCLSPVIVSVSFCVSVIICIEIDRM